MYVTTIIKERQTINLRAWGHGSCLRKSSWEGCEGGKGSSESYASPFHFKAY